MFYGNELASVLGICNYDEAVPSAGVFLLVHGRDFILFFCENCQIVR